MACQGARCTTGACLAVGRQQKSKIACVTPASAPAHGCVEPAIPGTVSWTPVQVLASGRRMNVMSCIVVTLSALSDKIDGPCAELHGPWKTWMGRPCRFAAKATRVSASQWDGTLWTSQDGKQTRSPSFGKKYSLKPSVTVSSSD